MTFKFKISPKDAGLEIVKVKINDNRTVDMSTDSSGNWIGSKNLDLGESNLEGSIRVTAAPGVEFDVEIKNDDLKIYCKDSNETSSGGVGIVDFDVKTDEEYADC